jgi:hypothetical protein
VEIVVEKYNDPFEYYVFDDFLNPEFAESLSNQFPPYDSEKWFSYNNPLEVKKTINNWYEFPAETYNFISYLNSRSFIKHYIEDLTGTDHLYCDQGLHGAGWHIHGNTGKLNLHLDYEIHPKLGLLRKYNLIIYLTKDWNPEWGGNLEFWSHDEETNQPKERKAKIDCVFNRAVLFDASQNSWHGFPEPINCPEGMYRKSIAMYYLMDVPENIQNRKRALYSPTEEQKHNPEIIELIKKRTS